MSKYGWTVVDKYENPYWFHTRPTRSESILTFVISERHKNNRRSHRQYDKTQMKYWRRFYRKGFRCKKVVVKE